VNRGLFFDALNKMSITNKYHKPPGLSGSSKEKQWGIGNVLYACFVRRNWMQSDNKYHMPPGLSGSSKQKQWGIGNVLYACFVRRNRMQSD